ncbi:MAG: hypothetical protein IJB97_00910 [Clostridia bacterium]|nr:hypothetical protein [Clostridia bacterium]
MQTLIKSTNAYKLLKAEKEHGRLHHAYLILHDDSRNLRAYLKIFAKLLFDVETPSNPKQERLSNLIDEELFSDCLTYPRVDKKFTVAESENVLEEIALRPIEQTKKVFLIADLAEATEQAQNKILKILEEPPQNVFFLLGASVSYPILQTVLSRSAKLEIHPFDQNQIESCLARLYEGNKNYSARDLSLCSAASGGSVGGAQNVLEGGFYKQLTEAAFALSLSTPFTLPPQAKKVADIKYKRELISLLRLIFRDALLIKTGKNAHLLLKTETENVQKISERYSENALLFAQEAFTNAEKEIRFNANFYQCIEICMFKIMERNMR